MMSGHAGEVIAIPERKMPAFKAGKTYKDVVAAKWLLRHKHRRGCVP